MELLDARHASTQSAPRRAPFTAMIIQVDQKKCNGCVECEALIPGFISTNHGRLEISHETLKLYLIDRAILSVMEVCPAGAISISRD